METNKTEISEINASSAEEIYSALTNGGNSSVNPGIYRVNYKPIPSDPDKNENVALMIDVGEDINRINWLGLAAGECRYSSEGTEKQNQNGWENVLLSQTQDENGKNISNAINVYPISEKDQSGNRIYQLPNPNNAQSCSEVIDVLNKCFNETLPVNIGGWSKGAQISLLIGNDYLETNPSATMNIVLCDPARGSASFAVDLTQEQIARLNLPNVSILWATSSETASACPDMDKNVNNGLNLYRLEIEFEGVPSDDVWANHDKIAKLLAESGLTELSTGNFDLLLTNSEGLDVKYLLDQYINGEKTNLDLSEINKLFQINESIEMDIALNKLSTMDSYSNNVSETRVDFGVLASGVQNLYSATSGIVVNVVGTISNTSLDNSIMTSVNSISNSIDLLSKKMTDEAYGILSIASHIEELDSMLASNAENGLNNINTSFNLNINNNIFGDVTSGNVECPSMDNINFKTDLFNASDINDLRNNITNNINNAIESLFSLKNGIIGLENSIDSGTNGVIFDCESTRIDEFINLIDGYIDRLDSYKDDCAASLNRLSGTMGKWSPMQYADIEEVKSDIQNATETINQCQRIIDSQHEVLDYDINGRVIGSHNEPSDSVISEKKSLINRLTDKINNEYKPHLEALYEFFDCIQEVIETIQNAFYNDCAPVISNINNLAALTSSDYPQYSNEPRNITNSGIALEKSNTEYTDIRSNFNDTIVYETNDNSKVIFNYDSNGNVTGMKRSYDLSKIDNPSEFINSISPNENNVEKIIQGNSCIDVVYSEENYKGLTQDTVMSQYAGIGELILPENKS